MRELIARYKIVTPMFIGGADQSPADGIRPPSVKGALRFWWRALNWGRFWTDTENEESALQALHKEEARLFGAAMGDKNNIGGQGCFLLSIIQPQHIIEIDNWPPDDPNNTASYLAYGLLKTNDEPHRFAIGENSSLDSKNEANGVEFKLKFIFKKHTDEIDIKQIKQVLEVWSLFGGLGGRSRRAMGSITLTAIDSNPVLHTKIEYEESIKKLLYLFNDTPKAPFSAFSKESLVHLVNTGSDAREIVRKMGAEYKDFRGQDGLRGQKKIPFGLPLQDVDLDNRRTSPLFFHVHELEKNKRVGIYLFIPTSVFHFKEEYKSTSMKIVEQFVCRGRT